MKDHRQISFSKEELYNAFSAYARKSPDFLPKGDLLSCTPKLKTEEGSSVEVAIKTSSGEKKILYRDTTVLQALILFCLENNVMLPRDGQKMFVVIDGRACLLIQLNLDFDLGLEAMTTEDISNLKKT
ncbi:MAG: hypothetical protein PHW76_10475 [Alphaproteobacteria bacterium]|nr:hypothetical protein [Alphaproteobacteria bacterium]